MSTDNKSESPLIWILEPLVPTGLVPAPEWFIEDCFPENCLGGLYGQPGVFKTWTAIAEVMCLGTGLPFCGKRTKRSKVLYIAADDPERPQQRAQAWVKHYESVLKERGIDPFANVVILKKAINLHTEREPLYATENIQRQGFKPDVIFIDTLFHSSIGADLNKPEDMLPIIDRTRKLVANLGARGSKIIHHTPKDGKSLFGTNALLASVDLLWRLEEVKDTPNKATLSCDRMRGARKFDPVELTFESIEMQMAPNSWGQEWVEQLVLAADTKPAPKKQTKEDQDLEDMEMNLECFLGNKATFTAWLEQMQKYFKDAKGWSKPTFTRKLDKLKKAGRVTGDGKQGDFYSVAHTPEAERARHGDTTAAATPVSEKSGLIKPVSVSSLKGDETGEAGFDMSEPVSNRSHETSEAGSRPDCKNDYTTQPAPGVARSDDDELIKEGIGEATKKRTY